MIAQGRGGKLTEASHRWLVDFMKWLRAKVRNFSPETRELIGEIEARMGRYRDNQQAAGNRSDRVCRPSGAEPIGASQSDPGRPAWLRIIDRHPQGDYAHNYGNPPLHLGRSLEAADRFGGGGGSASTRDGDRAKIASLVSSGTIPEFDETAFGRGSAILRDLGRHEHLVFHPGNAPRVYKITKPGKYGTGGGFTDYLHRIEESNQLFNDDVWLEGALLDSATGQYRLITSQPWIANAHAATPAQIERYFRQKGYLPYSERSFFNPGTETRLLGERIPMHHVQGLPLTIPLPASRHLDAHMPGGFRYNSGDIGSALPIYPLDFSLR